MKRISHLYELIIDKENIRQAIFTAAKGKRWRGAVRSVLSDVNTYVEKVHDLLANKTYEPCKVKERDIVEGSRQKERHITTIAFFPDQIIHWCLMRVLIPILTKKGYRLSCGSMPNRGTLHAAKFIRRWLRRDFHNTKYCLKLDIHHFYPSIRHDLLMEQLDRKFKDPNLRWLFEKIIDHWEASPDTGLPIGFLTSQWLANYALTPFDFYIKQKLMIPYYVRYMDDMLLFGSNKRQMHRKFGLLQNYLASAGLKVKDNWQLFRTDSRPIDCMGLRFYRDHTTLRRALMFRISHRAAAIIKPYSPKIEQAKSIMSYMGWIKHSDSNTFFETRVKPHVCIKTARQVISRFDKEHSINETVSL